MSSLLENSDFPLISSAILHEVKNNLAELQLRLASRGDASAEQTLVASCAQRLTDLLLAQRDAAGLLMADVDAESPADLLQELATIYRELFPTLTIEVRLDDAPMTAFYDAFLVRLALGNAVHNACQYAHSRVHLHANASDEGTVFEIADDGHGYPAELLERGTTIPARPGHNGTGLGLYLAGRIAALHRLGDRAGYIQLSNADAGGSVFRMMLP